MRLCDGESPQVWEGTLLPRLSPLRLWSWQQPLPACCLPELSLPTTLRAHGGPVVCLKCWLFSFSPEQGILKAKWPLIGSAGPLFFLVTEETGLKGMSVFSEIKIN